jgi:hypothetical protein
MTLTVNPDFEINAPQMAEDVSQLACVWLKKLDMPLKIEDASFEFVTGETLDYIEALENLLEELQGDGSTPDHVLERIEKVLK